MVLDSRSLLNQAQVVTGLSDFYQDGFLEGLEALVETYNRLDLISGGETYLDGWLTRLLATRLRVAEAWRRDPSIRERDLGSPLYIVGLWRSGTTSLYRRLAEDPRHRPLLFWEGFNPDPVDLQPGESDPRPEQIREFINMDRRPAFDAVHYIDVDLPEECALLLFHTFRDHQHGLEPLLEPYRGWFARGELEPAYDYYLDLLRTIDSQRPPAPGGNWLLKAPTHLWALDILVQRLPTARFVWTHRDPVEVVASWCSFVWTQSSRFTLQDKRDMGPPMLEHLATCAEQAMATRDKLGERLWVVDVDYRVEVSDPMRVAREVYETFGIPLKDEVADRFRSHSAAHRQHAHGRHVYTLEEYGLIAQQVRERFSTYIHRFLPETTDA